MSTAVVADGQLLGLLQAMIRDDSGPDELAVVAIIAVEALVTINGLGLYADGSCSAYELQMAATHLVEDGYLVVHATTGVLSLPTRYGVR